MPTFSMLGTPTFSGGACTIDSTDRVYSTDALLLSGVQGWMASRLRPSWASGTPPSVPRVFDPNVANGLLSYYASGAWTIETNGGTNFASVTSAHAAGDDKTIIFAWTSTTLYVSVNGAAFVSASKGTTPPAPTAWFIGNRSAADRPFTGDFHWVCGGSGTLSDADASTIHAFGNTDPTWSGVPGTITFLWTADSADYLDADPDRDIRYAPSLSVIAL